MATTYVYGDNPEEKKPAKPAPAAGPRDPEDGPMDETELQSIVDGLISSAEEYVDGELSPVRAQKTDYYFGRPFGNEEPGRSQFVSTEVRDGVQAVIPPMMRAIFSSGEKVVEFMATGPEDVDGAKLKTEFVHHVFAEENPGFLNTHSMIKDGLVRMTGVWKWWWDESTEVTQHKLENVSQEQLELLATDDEVELTRADQDRKTGLFTVEFTHTAKDGRARYAVIPPEEFLYNRESRDLESAVAIWHRTRKTRGELIALGIDADDIDEHGGDDSKLADNEEALARQAENSNVEDVDAGKANEKHLYYEGFARIDFDGDGIAELRKICAIGPAHHAVVNEPADGDINFAIFVPDPEPHTMTGQDWADRLMDLQRYKSMVMRGMSDSLAASLFPRVVYQAGQVSLADVLNTAMGAPIRSQGDVNATIREFAHTFLGKEAMPVIDLVDTLNERRTGNNRGALGLDADALQSSAPGAVEAAVSASQAQQEMLVRVFAETALKPLFKGLLKLYVKHQPRKKMMKLANQWVEIDPRTWNADVDVQVNVAIGSGMTAEKIATLQAISDKQFEIAGTLGPDNPIVGLKQIRDTLAEILELRGKKDASRYFKPVTEEQLKAMAEAAAAQGPPETPEDKMVKGQLEIERVKAEAAIKRDQEKAQRDLMIKQAEMSMEWQRVQMEDQRERERMKLEDDRARDKQASEIALKTRELELKHTADINEQLLTADIERERITSQAEPDSAS